MREILFRGKQMDNGRWVEGYLGKSVMHLETFHQNVVVDTIEVYDGESYLNIVFRNVSANSIGQFTGLADNIGRKIFEGDIVSIGGHDATVDGLYCVIYDATNHCWALKRSTEHHHHYFTFSDLNGFADTSTVVGNIHDNPELLEV